MESALAAVGHIVARIGGLQKESGHLTKAHRKQTIVNKFTSSRARFSICNFKKWESLRLLKTIRHRISDELPVLRAL